MDPSQRVPELLDAFATKKLHLEDGNDLSAYHFPPHRVVPLEPVATLAERVQVEINAHPPIKAPLGARMSELDASNDDPAHIHFILSLDSHLDIGDEPTPMRSFVAYQSTVQYGMKAQPPSSSAKFHVYIARQGTAPVFDGRHPVDKFTNTLAPPVELFSPSFAYFRGLLDDPAFCAGDETLLRTREYMDASRALYSSETLRSDALMPLLANVLSRSVGEVVVSTAKLDRVITFQVKSRMIASAVAEEKVEPGHGGCDAGVQAHASIEKFWVRDEVRGVRDACCCPTFAIALDGPWIRVLGCVLTDKWISQSLMPAHYAALDASLETEHCRTVSRVFEALSSALTHLKDWYTRVLDNPRPLGGDAAHPRMFPAPNSYTVAGGSVTFEYARPLERIANCFSERYGEEAHRLLAAADLAPELLYVGPPYPGMAYMRVQMIVMAYVRCAKPEPPSLTVCNAVRNVVELLHASDFVHGDVRLPNVLVDTEGRMRLIDFDWAGKEGVAKYPLDLSPEIVWPAGAGALLPIRKAHDLYMVNLEFPISSSQSLAKPSSRHREETDEPLEDSPPAQRLRQAVGSRQARPDHMDTE